MKVMKYLSLSFLLILTAQFALRAQDTATPRVVRISPYDQMVPGQIMEVLVEDSGAGLPPVVSSIQDYQIEISQDGNTRKIDARTVTSTLMRQAPDKSDTPGTTSPGSANVEFQAFQSVSFVVPPGLRVGEAELALSFRGRKSKPVKLTIVERPLTPVLGGVTVLTINPASLPPPPAGGTVVNDLGWRLERGAKAHFYLRPLVDPNSNGAILVRFKQGDAYLDAPATVTHQERKVEIRGRRRGHSPARDVLEVEIPAALAMGEARVEIRIRANGQTSDPVSFNVQITDAARVIEAPKQNSPRLLAITPRKVGAGQALMLSIDHLRTLSPDPSKVMIMVERAGVRYTVQPEMNSALQRPDQEPDAPVFLVGRPTRQIIGPAQVRIYNPLRGEDGGLSEAVQVEIADEVLPPEKTSVNVATEAELAALRQMTETQRSMGRPVPPFDPNSRYITIRARGLDYNPRFVRIRLEQEGRSTTLSQADFALYSADLLIVRIPKSVRPGTMGLSIENRIGDSFSTPVATTFELSR